MPMATAVWLVENTTLTFKQIADFCGSHEVEIQGIADGEVGKGIVGYNPIIAGQLTKEEIKLSTEDSNRQLILNKNETFFYLKYFHSKKHLSQFYCEMTIKPRIYSLESRV